MESSTSATPMAGRGGATPVIGVVVFLGVLAAYLRTMVPTVPFWDAGEFIAVSNILGIPHPPGTPFYVLLGRVAALLPLGSVARQVNGLSALASALAVMLTYLATLRLIRIAQQGGVTARAVGAGEPGAKAGGLLTGRGAEWLAQVGAVTAALMLAFSDNFWESGTEAEVYALASLAQVLVLWLALRWWEAHEQRPTVGPLLVSVYVMWLSVGVHLGVGMMGLPLIVLLLLVDRKVALLFAMPVVSVLGVTYGLERMAGIVLVLSVLVFWFYVAQGKLSAWLTLGATGAALYGAYFAFGDATFTPLGALTALAAVVVPVTALALRHREGRILALALFLMLAGYSTHLYLPIRAAQHPAINEGNPSTWPALKALLEREQYGHTSMFERRGTLQTQLDKEFWRYWKRQWPLAQTMDMQQPIPRAEEPRLWQVFLPLLLGGLGGFWQARRERASFLTMLTLFLFATVGMVLFLNFSNNEVRDRDYFFATGYHAYAIWMGLGLVWLVLWVRDSFRGTPARRWATVAATVLLAAQPFMIARNLWYFHDRSRDYVAHDYARNMLASLAPNSFVFTNGDNDTFPLWYMQEVENFRRDVRVVCLALLQTDWYIFQMRDQEPKVPMNLSDEVIRAIGYGAFQDQTGRVVKTNEFMMRHMIEQSQRGDGWVKQPYVAVSVPEHAGLDRYFTLEGLVYRVNRDTLQGTMDEAATRGNLYERYSYRGLFDADGSWDRSVYKDEQAANLSRNYANAHVQLAFQYRQRRQFPEAIRELEWVLRMFPDYIDATIPLGRFYMEMGDSSHALGLFRDLVRTSPDYPDGRYHYGVVLALQRDLAGALREFDTAIRLDPAYAQAYWGAYLALSQSGQRERALTYLQRLVEVDPGDQQAQALLQTAHPPGASSAPVPSPAPPGR